MSDTIPTPTYPGSPLGPGFMPIETVSGTTKTVATTSGSVHPDYTKGLDRVTLCRDAVEGEDAVRAKGTLYLPKPSGMNTTQYTAYSQRGSYTNATGRAQDGLEGLIFRKKPTAILPPELEELAIDITTTGLSLDELAKKATHEDIIAGRGGLLTEYPIVIPGEDRVIADVEANGERAYLAFYAYEDILNWREGRVKNKTQLTWLKLREWLEVGDNDKTAYAELIREISLDANGDCFQRVYVAGKKDTANDVPIIVRNAPLKYIPFVPLGPVTASIEVQKPPVYDIAVKNVHHWQLSADRRHALHWADNPTPVVCGTIMGKDGMPVDVISLGASEVLNLAAGGDAKYLEFQGNGLQPTKDQMNEDMAEMAVLLSRILAGDSKAAEAAETAAIHRAGENAVLASIANALSSGFTKALVMLADFMGVDGSKISYRLNTNFYPTPMSSQMFIAMTNAVIAGTLSIEETPASLGT
jgi:hypothetical protein